MKKVSFSEAIVLGSISTGQSFGVLEDSSGNTCAWGAAYAGGGILRQIQEAAVGILGYHKIRALIADQGWLWTWEKYTQCPECKTTHNVGYLVAHLNDRHKWTRPAIAAWAKQYEPVEPMESVEPTAAPEQPAVAVVEEFVGVA